MTNGYRGEVDALPPPMKTAALGLQHVLAMYAGAVAVPLILGAAIGLDKRHVALLVSADLFTCGIATLLQTLGFGKYIGIRLPLMMGVTMVALAPMVQIASSQGLQYVYGAIIVSGAVVVLSAGMFTSLLQFFPPVVTGCVITAIGVNLLPVALNWAAGGNGVADFGAPFNLGLAAGVIVLITVFTRFGGHFISAIALLLAMAAGSLAALLAGKMSLSGIGAEPWAAFPHPFWFGLPKFHLAAILNMLCVMLVTVMESTGVFLSMGRITGVCVGRKEVSAGLRAEGIAAIIGSVLNSFPYITFSQNLGLVALTQVKSRYVIAFGGVILLLLGTLPKLAIVVASIPAPVLGGAALAMFGTVAASGIRTLSEVDYNRQGNMFIVAISLGLGIGSAMTPSLFAKCPAFVQHMAGNGLLLCAVSAIFLNWLFTGAKGEGCPSGGGD